MRISLPHSILLSGTKNTRQAVMSASAGGDDGDFLELDAEARQLPDLHTHLGREDARRKIEKGRKAIQRQNVQSAVRIHCISSSFRSI